MNPRHSYISIKPTLEERANEWWDNLDYREKERLQRAMIIKEYKERNKK
jgi:hypothetical protein